MDVSTYSTLIIQNAKIAFQAVNTMQFPFLDQNNQAFLIAFGTVAPSPVGPVSCYAAVMYRERGSNITKVFLKGPSKPTVEEAIRALFDTSMEAIQVVLGQQMNTTLGVATHNGGRLIA